MVLVVGPVLVVVVVEVLGTVVVLTGAVVVVVVLVMVVVVLGATVVLVEVVGLDVLLVSAASAPLAGKKAMAATTAPTVTTMEPSLDKAGLPRPAGVVGGSCRGWPPPAMAIDWPIRDGARCAVPDVLLRPGPAQQRSPAGRQPPRALSGPPSPARNDLLERIPPDRIVRLLALSGQRVRRAATSQPTGRPVPCPLGWPLLCSPWIGRPRACTGGASGPRPTASPSARTCGHSAPDSIWWSRGSPGGAANWRPDQLAGEDAHVPAPLPPATWHPPMLAQPLRMPEERRLVDQPGWLFERKLDGLRCLAVRNGIEVELWSRNRLPFTPRFPDVAATLAALPVDDFTIDGELVAFDDKRTSFGLLQRPESGALAEFHAFDLLHLLGRDTTILPLVDRRRLLAQALAGAGPAVHLVEVVEGDPQVLLEQACAAGWEGIIAKRADRPYRSGRSPDWRKLKCSVSQEFVVGGWSDPAGSRIGLGALLVGYYDEQGSCATPAGWAPASTTRSWPPCDGSWTGLPSISHRSQKRRESRGCHWVRPHLVVTVDFTEWTHDGRLRHPRFGGVRVDKSPTDVRRETLAD